jgi:hypothetical protein
MTTRREPIIALGAGAIAPPPTAFGQQQLVRVARVARRSYPSDQDPGLALLREGMHQSGLGDGKSSVMVARCADGNLPACLCTSTCGSPSVSTPSSGVDRRAREEITRRAKVGHHGLFYHLIIAAIVIFPSWKIFQRVGLNPALSLFVFVPGLGWWIVGAILAYSKWPAIDASSSGGTTNG